MVEGSGREGGQFSDSNGSNLRVNFAFYYSMTSFVSVFACLFLWFFNLPIALVRKRYFLRRRKLLLLPGLDTEHLGRASLSPLCACLSWILVEMRGGGNLTWGTTGKW